MTPVTDRSDRLRRMGALAALTVPLDACSCSPWLSRLALVVMVGLFPIPHATAIDPGQMAPAFSIPEANGKPTQLSALRGKLVYVDFWASWCAPCRRSFPWMNAMQQKYRDKGLVIVGINVDQRASDAEKFLAQVPATFTVVYDPQGKVPKDYAIKGMPSSVLIDPQGKVLAVHSGFRDDDRDALESAIVASLPQRVN